MCKKDHKKEGNPWVVFWCAVIIFGSLACFSVWYEDNYCEGTAIPVRCSK